MQKVEQEALDPVELRSLVVDAIDGVIDAKALKRAKDTERRGRARIAKRLGGKKRG